MKKIAWCKSKSGGLILCDSNVNLSSAYLKKANESLESIFLNKYKDWKLATEYYAIYFSLYSILLKIGVKCEIHSCTIEFVNVFLKKYFSSDDLVFIKKALKSRIDSQYYVDKVVLDKDFYNIINSAPMFFLKCKSILSKLNEKAILDIRTNFKNNFNS